MPPYFSVAVALAALAFPCCSGLHAEESALSRRQETEKQREAPDLARARQILDEWEGDPRALSTAYENIKLILKQNPSNAPAQRELARLYMMNGHARGEDVSPEALRNADKALGKAVEIDPDYADAYVLLGALRRLMNQGDLARQALQKAEALGSDDPWLHNEWGALLKDERQCEEAVVHYRKVLGMKASTKTKMTALNGIVVCGNYRKDYDAADQAYRDELALEPASPTTLGDYSGFLSCHKGDFDAAIENARKAQHLMDFGMGRLALAVALYGKASKVKGDDAQSLRSEAQKNFPDTESIRKDVRDCEYGEAIAAGFGGG